LACSTFFGLAFTMTVAADTRLRDKMAAARRHRSAKYKQSHAFPAGWSDKLTRHAVAEVASLVKRILAQGRGIPAKAYDLAGAQNRSAREMREVAEILLLMAGSPQQTAAARKKLEAIVGRLIKRRLGPQVSSSRLRKELLGNTRQLIAGAAAGSHVLGKKLNSRVALTSLAASD
jgi:hypothetical protein